MLLQATKGSLDIVGTVMLGYSWQRQGQLESSHTCLLDQIVVVALILYHKRYKCQVLKHCFVTHPVLVVIVMSVQTGWPTESCTWGDSSNGDMFFFSVNIYPEVGLSLEPESFS